MNIFKFEFNAKLKSVLTWAASIIVLTVAFMAMFETFSADTAMVTKLMASFPPELLTAFGMTDMVWSTILGFFGLLFVFAQICLAIQAANYGFALVSVEEAEWTADFLLSKPVTRVSIMTSKYLAAIAALGLTDILVCAASIASIEIFRQGQAYDMKAVTMLLLSIPVFQLFFLSVGVFISLLVKRVRNVTPFSMGLVFGLYILNAFSDMIGEKSLEIISPFQHFTPSYIIKNASWDLPMVMISVVFIMLTFVGSYFLYARRNIASAI